MITIYRKEGAVKDKQEIELRGLSTDEKPINVENGTIFIEIDTGKIYMFDVVSKTWKEL